jgi:APA family basic amino acid/polyamine antiporter
MPRAGGQYRVLARGVLTHVGIPLRLDSVRRESRPEPSRRWALPSRAILGVLWPVISENRYVIAPIHVSSGYALSLSTAQLVAILVILFLTYTNTLGIQYGKRVQNVFTVAKIGSLVGLVGLGIFFGWNRASGGGNFGDLWTAARGSRLSPLD